MCFCVRFSFLAALLRLLSTTLPNPSFNRLLLHTSCILNALGFPMVLTIPSKVAMLWY